MGVRIRRGTVLFVAGLVLLDMAIKLVIQHWFIEDKILLTQNFGIVPHLNRDQLSILNKELGGNVSLGWLILLNCVVLVLSFFVFRWVQEGALDNKPMEYAKRLCYAGVVCSLLDKLFWGGSLDYIMVFTQIIDLKDIYLAMAVLLGCIGIVVAIKRANNISNNVNDVSL